MTSKSLLRNRLSTALTKINKKSAHAADQAAFEAQKNEPGGKKTLKAWYWMVEGEAYDTLHPRD